MLKKAASIFRLGKNHSAIIYYDEIIQRYSTNQRAYIGKSKVLTAMGKYEEALKIIQKAIHLD